MSKNLFVLYRNSHPEMFLRKGVLKICSKYTGEHPYRSAISIKLPWKLVPLKYSILHRCSIAFIIHNFWILLILLIFCNLNFFLTALLLRALSDKNPLKFQWLNKHPGRYLEDLRYSQKLLVWKSFGQILIEILFVQILTYLDCHWKL